MKHFLIIIFSIITIAFSLASITYAATNIDPNYPNYYAWNDKIGWIDFKTSSTINVASHFIDGYANLGSGYLSFNCLTGPSGSDCSSVNYSVTNDGTGDLSGWAWSDSVGWVSLDCHNPETGGTGPDYSCATSPYQVIINASTGEFSGYAWNDTIGWISFNCDQTSAGGSSTCATVDYQVKTVWAASPATASVVSGTFDTGHDTGSAFNYIVWRGALNGGQVSFQFATSSCSNGATDAPACVTNIGWGGSKTSGDGALLGPTGTTAEGDAYSSIGPDLPISLANQSTHNNKRYFRYKVYLETDIARSATPIVQDVIVNWSP